MRTFKVISLSCAGHNNKIYKSGDIVRENNFPEGRADELVRGKFIEEIKVSVTDEDLQEKIDKKIEEFNNSIDNAKDESKEKSLLDSIDDNIEDEAEDEFAGKTHKNFTLQLLKEKCNERGIDFNDSDTKKVLFDLLVGK